MSASMLGWMSGGCGDADESLRLEWPFGLVSPNDVIGIQTVREATCGREASVRQCIFILSEVEDEQGTA
jgi:hypothetical protein